MSFIRNQISYDKQYDVLYYHIGDTNNSYGDEIDNKIVLLRDIDTDVLTGITMFDFREVCTVDCSKMRILEQYFDISAVLEIVNET